MTNEFVASVIPPDIFLFLRKNEADIWYLLTGFTNCVINVECWMSPDCGVWLQGSQGRAYLFNSVVNVGCGPAEERVLLTGLHAVADIFCDCCKTTLGTAAWFIAADPVAYWFYNYLLSRQYKPLYRHASE